MILAYAMGGVDFMPSRMVATALATSIAWASPTAARDDGGRPEHGEMRRLYREYQRFKDSAAFRKHGYAIGGPFNAWSQRITALNSENSYALLLSVMCDVTPIDLWMAGTMAYKGETDTHRQRTEAAFAKCFPR